MISAPQSDRIERPLQIIRSYGIAIAAVAIAALATLWLGSAMKHPATFFFCSVVLSSRFGGIWAGIFATLVSAIALDYFFIPPLYGLGIGAEEAPDMMAFLASALLVGWLSGGRKRVLNSVAETSEKPSAKVFPTDCGPGHAEDLREETAHSRTEEDGFFKQGEYWTIQYQGEIGQFKATRGFYCLAILLQNPGREFHVREFSGILLDSSATDGRDGLMCNSKDGSVQARAALGDAGPVLDWRGKAECTRRLQELSEELKEAERLNDPQRAETARQERESIASYLAGAVGLGGRDRKASSQTERARSAVTKRIKGSIHKLTETMPALGCHLAATIKTGYFCSYNPGPASAIRWKVRL
jgi:hypothetical protein